MEYLIGIIIGIFAYSFILTVLTIYQDNSSYFIVSTLDAIMAGPVCWLVMLICCITRKVVNMLHIDVKKQDKEYKKKSQKYIKRIVKKVVKEFKKRKCSSEYYFDFDSMDGDDYNEYNGYMQLLNRKASNEWLNNKFRLLMCCQKEETKEELMKYFEPVTEERMIDDEQAEWYIQQYKDKGLVVLK